MDKQYTLFSEFLPEKCTSILDIGCWLGLQNLNIYEHYNCDNNLIFYLCDKNQIDNNIHFGYTKNPSFYNDFEKTIKIYENYGINKNNIHIINANINNCLQTINTKIDLIVSYISWGFHYPLNFYLKDVFFDFSFIFLFEINHF